MILIQPRVLLLLLLLAGAAGTTISAADDGFSFLFDDSQLDGVREIQSDGRVVHTNDTEMFGVGHTFYSRPFRFKNSTTGDAFSFSTSFVFGIIPENPLFTFHGMTFAIAPSKEVIDASSSQHLGLFNRTNDGNASNHVVAIELDTFRNLELGDMDGNHVGLDINSIVSVLAATAGYYENGVFQNLTLASSREIRAWIDYDGVKKTIDVTLAPLPLKKPEKPLVSWKKDLSPFLLEEMYVGFTSATGVLLQRFYVVGWSFQMNGEAQEIDISKVPRLSLKKKSTKKKTMGLAIGLSLGGLLVLSLISLVAFVLFRRRKRKFAEVLESWEVQYGPHSSNPEFTLTWKQRVKIIIDVAEALAYLHEEWCEVIIHRDIKASNVLLDADLNGKLGDFGLARFGNNNGTDAKTTHLAGTLGYIAPELARKGKATTATDIFAFGAFCLEVVCGRRPVELQGRQEAVILVDYVLDCWFKETLSQAVDPKLKDDLDVEEMDLVLKVGLLCSHSVPAGEAEHVASFEISYRKRAIAGGFRYCVGDKR
ncbi:unnamed protein product [Lactuca virosa]|uniref:non-specific serine/threonine protein kinase n=1 Tax=Lactuca virosa TaxID=75947 RepID=A0AAU9LY55_9ASTR|nr:unnamed protein product [Lactuca virosa]